MPAGMIPTTQGAMLNTSSSHPMVWGLGISSRPPCLGTQRRKRGNPGGIVLCSRHDRALSIPPASPDLAGITKKGLGRKLPQTYPHPAARGETPHQLPTMLSEFYTKLSPDHSLVADHTLRFLHKLVSRPLVSCPPCSPSSPQTCLQTTHCHWTAPLWLSWLQEPHAALMAMRNV